MHVHVAYIVEVVTVASRHVENAVHARRCNLHVHKLLGEDGADVEREARGTAVQSVLDHGSYAS